MGCCLSIIIIDNVIMRMSPKHVVTVSECTLTHLVVEGASDANGTINEYQRSRQFKLRAVLLKPADCEDVNLLVKTTVEWSATLQQPPATEVQFDTTTKELVVPSNTLEYGTNSINVVVVSQHICVYSTNTRLVHLCQGCNVTWYICLMVISGSV